MRHIEVCVQGTGGNIGPSIIAWAGFHYGGKRELAVLNGTINQQMYRCELQQSSVPWARATTQKNYILVQDNAPLETDGAADGLLENQDVGVLDGPSKIPDMTTKEHLWDQTAVQILDMDNLSTMAAQLHEAVHEAVVSNMPCRVCVTASINQPYTMPLITLPTYEI